MNKEEKNKEAMRSVVVEVIKYNLNNRSINEAGNCSYDDGEGNRCPIGHFLSKDGLIFAKELEENDCTCSSYKLLYMSHKEKMQSYKLFKKGYNDLPHEFWTRVQNLHDNELFWDDLGLSERGETAMAIIKSEFGL